MGFKIKKKSLTKVHGLGHKKVSFIFNEIGANNKKKNFLFKFSGSKKIKTFIKKFSFSDTLKSKIRRVISNKIKIKNYIGVRHLFNYPCRGQRTHTNAKTVKKSKKKNV